MEIWINQGRDTRGKTAVSRSRQSPHPRLVHLMAGTCRVAARRISPQYPARRRAISPKAFQHFKRLQAQQTCSCFTC